jgi:aryl-alcohol dehydrogenase-like predicted oxidoreductase
VPEYIYGTAGLHRVGWGPSRRRLLRIAFDTGFRAFDTAPLYGNGLAECEIGAELSADRAQISITTKFGIPVSLYGAARPWTFTAERALRMTLDPGYRASFAKRDWSVARMRADLEGSLRRMRTDYVDRFCLHEPLENIPAGVWDDLRGAADTLKREGKIRAFGLSGEQAVMAALVQRQGLDFVQMRIGALPAPGSFSGPVFAYGAYAAYRSSGKADFNAFLAAGPGGPAARAYLLSSIKPAAVAAYRPLFG